MSTKKFISKCCVLVPLSTMLGVNLDLGFICFQGRYQVGPSSFPFKSVIFIDIFLTHSPFKWKENLAKVQYYKSFNFQFSIDYEGSQHYQDKEDTQHDSLIKNVTFVQISLL